MSYSEENGQVILRMSREDYDQLIYGLGLLLGKSFFGGDPKALIAFMNRLNSGNPNYTPYQVGDK
jgi:hypothetical protein